MARKKNIPVRQPGLWGIPLEKWREMLGFLLCALGLLVLLSLMAQSAGQAWTGRLGAFVSGLVNLLLGRWMAYALPLLLLLAAVHAFRGSVPFHPIRKLVAGTLILFSLCALRALPAVLYPGLYEQSEAFWHGGLLGHFLVSDMGLGLAPMLGPAGAYLIFSCLLLLGVMLSTDFLFLPLVQGILRYIRQTLAAWKQKARVPRLHFKKKTKRTPSDTVFPVLASRDSAARKPAPAEPAADLDAHAALDEEPDVPAETPATEEEPDIFSHIEMRAAQKKGAEPIPMMQTELDFSGVNFAPPPIDIFSNPPEMDDTMDRDEVLAISGQLEKALDDFGIAARVIAVTQGPVVTRYELQPAPGIKVSRILNLENDIAMILKAKSVRIQAPIPGKAAIGVEVPNRKVTPVYFKELISDQDFRSHKSSLAFVLGKNISGEPVLCDLASMPHLLVAGTTGSGKSVCVNVIISSFLYRMPPDKVKFIMIDPKRVELNVYSDIPHLLAPVVNEPRQAAAALNWAVQQMEERLDLFSKLRVRNIDGYNDVVTGKRKPARGVQIDDLHYLPHIVIVIDELADLMLIAKKEVEDFIVRLAQMSRAAGIHMIIATQRPSVNVLTGIIKANFPSRIAFRVSAKVDSRTILDTNGAETLLGKGDMLFCPGGTKPMRIQGAFLSDHDVEKLTEHLRAQTPAAYEKEDFSNELDEDITQEGAELEPGVLEEPENPGAEALSSASLSQGPNLATGGTQVEFGEITLSGDMDEDEELYDKALRMVLESGKPSVSMIQRRLKIGFARAGRLMDLMEERNIVGPYQGSKPRNLLVDDPEALLRRLDEIERDRATGQI